MTQSIQSEYYPILYDQKSQEKATLVKVWT
jgi:hypothetical protein